MNDKLGNENVILIGKKWKGREATRNT